ncbi:MAG TPA: hypothetical protein GX711_02495, partial [Clostridia bacterium]|nr:hypothetical protein [Clostridia bacterium]
LPLRFWNGRLANSFKRPCISTFKLAKLKNCLPRNHSNSQVSNFLEALPGRKRKKRKLKILREERAVGDISDEEYKKMRNEYSDELAELQKKLGKLNDQANNSSEMVFQEWERKIKNIEQVYEKYFSIKELNRELVIKLVEKITVNKNREISEIVFRGESPFELAEELKTELESIAVG